MVFAVTNPLAEHVLNNHQSPLIKKFFTTSTNSTVALEVVDFVDKACWTGMRGGLRIALPPNNAASGQESQADPVALGPERL
ncbi:hypothetical protein MHYP_G00323440 [Metynnis hypsauchen]